MFSRTWLEDAAERVLSTFIQAFLGVTGVGALVAATTSHDWHALAVLARSGEAAGLAAVIALGKSVAASRKAGTVSPASLAPAPTHRHRRHRSTTPAR